MFCVFICILIGYVTSIVKTSGVYCLIRLISKVMTCYILGMLITADSLNTGVRGCSKFCVYNESGNCVQVTRHLTARLAGGSSQLDAT